MSKHDRGRFAEFAFEPFGKIKNITVSQVVGNLGQVHAGFGHQFTSVIEFFAVDIFGHRGVHVLFEQAAGVRRRNADSLTDLLQPQRMGQIFLDIDHNAIESGRQGIILMGALGNIG